MQLNVADDDAGQDVESTTVRVLTPEQAVLELIAMIDAEIANTTDAKVRKSLEHARKALTGSNPNSNNGALRKIQEGNNSAAVAFIGTSVTWLQRAQEDGANVAVPIALLEQVAAALGGA